MHTHAEIMPAVSEALARIAGERPSSPLRLLGEHLIREAQKVRTVQWVNAPHLCSIPGSVCVGGVEL